MFTLEWDDQGLEIADKQTIGKFSKKSDITQRIPKSPHNRNGRPIRPLMQSLPISLVKQQIVSTSLSKLHSNLSIHTEYVHQQHLNLDTVDGRNTGKYKYTVLLNYIHSTSYKKVSGIRFQNQSVITFTLQAPYSCKMYPQ